MDFDFTKNINAGEIHIRRPDTKELFVQQLSEAVDSGLKNGDYTDIVLLCAGSTYSVGDSLGAEIGSRLYSHFNTGRYVTNDDGNVAGYVLRGGMYLFGDISRPVDGENMHRTIKLIRENYKSPFTIVAISALGDGAENIGRIKIKKGPVIMGSGIGKNFGEIGDVTILGVVNTKALLRSESDNRSRLKSALADDVQKLSEFISEGMIEVLEKRIRRQQLAKSSMSIFRNQSGTDILHMPFM